MGAQKMGGLKSIIMSIVNAINAQLRLPFRVLIQFIVLKTNRHCRQFSYPLGEIRAWCVSRPIWINFPKKKKKNEEAQANCLRKKFRMLGRALNKVNLGEYGRKSEKFRRSRNRRLFLRHPLGKSASQTYTLRWGVWEYVYAWPLDKQKHNQNQRAHRLTTAEANTRTNIHTRTYPCIRVYAQKTGAQSRLTGNEVRPLWPAISHVINKEAAESKPSDPKLCKCWPTVSRTVGRISPVPPFPYVCTSSLQCVYSWTGIA